MKTKHSWLRRSVALLLVAVTFLQWFPVQVFSVDADSGYIPGDVNSDTRVDAMDVVLIRRYIASSGLGVSINTLAADVDADGGITEGDVAAIRKYVVGGHGVELQ